MQQRHVFHSFDALRFLAFLPVFMAHLPKPEGNQFLNTLFFEGGAYSVEFFFVLSGFLISYLLAYEYAQNGAISPKNYLMRRGLRIWPLYYLCVLIAFTNNFITARLAIGSSLGYDPNPAFTLSFLENYQMIARDNFPNGAPLRVFWSLCIEEHFYLLWLVVFLAIPQRHFIKAVCCLWATGILYRTWFYVQFPEKGIYDYDVLSKMDYFCAGSITGFLVATRTEEVFRRVRALPVLLRYGFTVVAAIYIFTYQFYATGRKMDLFMPVVAAPLFAFFLLTVSASATFIYFSKRHVLSRLGEMSYGLYVFHTVVIVTLMALAKKTGIALDHTGNYAVFAVTAFLITLLITTLSWRYFESYFLRKKEKYAVKVKRRAVVQPGTPEYQQ